MAAALIGTIGVHHGGKGRHGYAWNHNFYNGIKFLLCKAAAISRQGTY
ncbi:MAG: hypothetical protein Q4G07_07855 [Oscillospiraceae bacterium]|nr:hypothetical protein [Oscillospiraceae bacterium]